MMASTITTPMASQLTPLDVKVSALGREITLS
jgi:hypothetical protein